MKKSQLFLSTLFLALAFKAVGKNTRYSSQNAPASREPEPSLLEKTAQKDLRKAAKSGDLEAVRRILNKNPRSCWILEGEEGKKALDLAKESNHKPVAIVN